MESIIQPRTNPSSAILLAMSYSYHREGCCCPCGVSMLSIGDHVVTTMLIHIDWRKAGSKAAVEAFKDNNEHHWRSLCIVTDRGRAAAGENTENA